jgi:hypothetical protein
MLKRFAFLAAIIACFGMLAPLSMVCAQELDEFLVAYWPLDENEGVEVHDATENGNDGDIVGAEWVDGKFESALEFDGLGNHVVVPDSDSLDVSAELTITVWVKLDDLLELKDVLRKHGSYALEITFRNVVQMNTWVGGFWFAGRAIGGPPLEPGVWYFLAGVDLPEAGLELYIDGVKVADGNEEGDVDITEEPLHIGTATPGWLPFGGIIDEVKIFNKALTVDEIQKVMRRSGGQEAVKPQDKATATWGSIKVEYAL